MKPALQTFALTARQIVRFWANVDRQADGCWIWRGHCFTNGYGKFNANYRTVCAHRMTWFLTNGPIPAGISVLHRCDVRNCVNPSHLFLGTQADNLADMRAKGREARGDRHGMRKHPECACRGERHWAHQHPERLRGDNNPTRRHPECVRRGENHSFARLTEAQVTELRDLRKSGVSYRSLAEHFGLSPQHAWKIATGRAWAHLGGVA